MSWLTTTVAPAKRLKKRSVANSTSPKPPEELTFFLDRQLGRYKMAGALRKAGLNIEIHDDHFAQDAEDPEWLTAVGGKNWIVVTRDERIRYRAAEKHAISKAKVRAFVLVARGDLRAEALAEIFLKALPKIRKALRKISASQSARRSPRATKTNAEIFLKALPKIRKMAVKQNPPFIAKVWRDGGVALLD